MSKSKGSVGRRSLVTGIAAGVAGLLAKPWTIKAQQLLAQTQVVNVLYQNGSFSYSVAAAVPTAPRHGFVHRFPSTGTINWACWQNTTQRVTVEFKGDANCPFVWNDGSHWSNGIATFPDPSGRQAILKPGWPVDNNDAIKYSIIVYDSGVTPIVDDPEVIIVDA